MKLLKDIYNGLRGNGTHDVIFAGDFNFHLGETPENDKEIMEAIYAIAEDDVYQPLIRGATMTSLKLTHTNDNIIIPGEFGKDCEAYILSPFDALKCEGTEYSLVRATDVNRLLIPLFTDHWPVGAFIKVPGAKKKV